MVSWAVAPAVCGEAVVPSTPRVHPVNVCGDVAPGALLSWMCSAPMTMVKG